MDVKEKFLLISAYWPFQWMAEKWYTHNETRQIYIFIMATKITILGEIGIIMWKMVWGELK